MSDGSVPTLCVLFLIALTVAIIFGVAYSHTPTIIEHATVERVGGATHTGRVWIRSGTVLVTEGAASIEIDADAVTAIRREGGTDDE